MSYQLREVLTARDVAAFHKVAHVVYANDAHWVCPLKPEIESIFNPERNRMFLDGKAKRWVLEDEKGNLLGRVAAFFNRTRAAHFEQPTGGMGFFECVEDREAAFFLFDTAKKWLASEGIEAMDGPVNFGENDTYWGLLVEGFTHPSYGMNYHKPYYREFFEAYGFEMYFEQVSKHLDASTPMPERFRKIYDWIRKKPNVRIAHADPKDYAKAGRDFMTIFNDAWRHHEDFSEMSQEDVDRIVAKLRHVIIPEFLIFAYVDDEPAGFVMALPDLNQIFKPLKGKFGLWQKLQFKLRSRNNFAWYRKRGLLDRLRVTVIGVRPKFQKYGIESAVTIHNYETCRKMGFREIELSWVGDYNPMSRKLQDATNAKLGKIHRTYRYLFDQEKRFERHETLTRDARQL
ncbi:MAG: GNAT family N-acetyltransferase [Bacteroidota bacterium]